MPSDQLVSENESSSEESIIATPGVPDFIRKELSESVKIEANSKLKQEQEQKFVEKEEEYFNDDEEKEQDTPIPIHSNTDIYRESTDESSIIKNQTVKSRITLHQSVLLTKLSPDSNKAIAKIEQPTNTKIKVRLVPIASTPELKTNVFKISEQQPFSTLMKVITNRLRKRLPDKNGVIHFYIHNSFVPCPDEIIGDLYSHFGNNEELVISYSTVVAFG